ncbi:hypothetical protein [Amycolatopsis sp. NPDC058986]|uniref:hypothetical protein n=1 Tax=unclassified Amycolatopsis TaxID=2618356 RepID=UPI00366EC1AD
MRLVRLAQQPSRVAEDVRAALASLGRGSTVIGGVALIGADPVGEGAPVEAVVVLPKGVLIVIGVDLPDPALRLEAPLSAQWKADGWPLVHGDDTVNPATEALDVSQACERRIAEIAPGAAPIGTILAVGPYVETVEQPPADLAGPVRVLYPTPTSMLAATVSLATARRPRSIDQARALIEALAPGTPDLSDEVLLGEGFSQFSDNEQTVIRENPLVAAAPTRPVPPQEPPAKPAPAPVPAAVPSPPAASAAAPVASAAPAAPAVKQAEQTPAKTPPPRRTPAPPVAQRPPTPPSAVSDPDPAPAAPPAATSASAPTSTVAAASTAGAPPHQPDQPRSESAQPEKKSRTVRWLPIGAIGLLVVLLVAAIVVAANSSSDTPAPTASPSTPAATPPPTPVSSAPPSTAPVQSLEFTRRASSADQRCASHAFGDVQVSLQRTSCAGVRRASFAATVDGRPAAVTVGIVDFTSSGQAAAFKAIADTPGGGGILDVATETGQWNGEVPRFENAAYQSKLDGASVRVVQAVWLTGPSTSDDPALTRAAQGALDQPVS